MAPVKHWFLGFILFLAIIFIGLAITGCGGNQQEAATIMADATLVSTDVLDAAVNNPASTPAQIKLYATECLTLCRDANAHYLAFGQFDPNKASADIQWAIQQGVLLFPYLMDLAAVFGDEHSSPTQQALAKQRFNTAYHNYKAAHPAPK